ncbi:MAG: VCBS repeat-containing protein [Verrucomicrobia bacterium]|nr:VCBS repeat-containing protein [Verrucomicrobiota bacterium]
MSVRFVLVLGAIGLIPFAAQPAALLEYRVTYEGLQGPVAIADYDANGWIDWLGTDLEFTTGPGLLLFSGTSSLHFQGSPLPRTDIVNPQPLAVDVDNDGDVDLTLSGWVNSIGNFVQILRHDRGVWTSAFRCEGIAIASSDLDNDGDQDLLMLPRYDFGPMTVAWNDGVGGFVLGTEQIGAQVKEVAIQDLDGDGDQDLVVVDYADDSVAWIIRNDGTGRFEPTGISLTTAGLAQVDWGDPDLDGDLDVLCPAQAQDGSLVPLVLRNHGGFRFDALPSFLTPAAGYDCHWGDYSDDGWPDAAICGYRSSSVVVLPTPLEAGVYLNDGHGELAEVLSVWPGFLGPNIGAADFDHDGDLDVLLGGSAPLSDGLSSVAVYRNNTTNPPPTIAVPANLRATPYPSNVLLEWDLPDGAPPGETGSYNLRVGSQPGLGDIINPVADENGTRFLTGLGNVPASRSFRLRSLGPGTYFWSVQRVGPSFAGSAFAPEQSFTIEGNESNQRPSIESIPALVAFEDHAFDPISVAVDDAESPPEVLRVFASSSNPALLSVAGIEITGTDSQRIVSLTPSTNSNGTAWITLTVEDEAGDRASTTFLATVLPVNDSPFLEPLPNTVSYQHAGRVVIPLHFGDAETSIYELTLTATSSNPLLVPSDSMTFENPPLALLLVTPEPNRMGQATITVEVADGEAVATQSFVLVVEPLTFTPELRPFPVLVNTDFLPADWDGDDDLDLLVLSSEPNWPNRPGLNYLLRNDGHGSLANAYSLPPLDGASSAWADDDLDGDLDLLIAGFATVEFGGREFSVHLLRNDRIPGIPWTTEFSRIQTDITNGPVSIAAWADLDLDGRPDVVMQGPDLAVYRNHGDGHFSRSLLPTLDMSVNLVVVQDSDGDAIPDLLISGGTTSGQPITRLLRNAGGSFALATLDLPVHARQAGWLDLDQDGDLDLWLVVAEWIPNSTPPYPARLRLYDNDGAGALTEILCLPTTAVDLTWCDIDADGDADVIAGLRQDSSYSVPFDPGTSVASHTAFRNDGDWRFEPIGPLLGNIDAAHPVPVDMDNDGDPDFVATMPAADSPNPWPGTADSYRVGVIRNQGNDFNPPPSPPTHLMASVHERSAQLSWAPGIDSNQRLGHIYNLRVGTTPGAGDVLSPLSNPTGFRLLPIPGNAGSRTSLTLTNLDREVYYWSVQAVDASLAGSAFAPEQRLVISEGNEQPVLGAISEQTTQEETLLEVPLPVADDRTSLEALRWAAYSTEPDLVPLSHLSIHWTGTQWTLHLTPALNRTGTCSITLVVIDLPGAMTLGSFNLTVTDVNDAPSISPVPDQETLLGMPSAPVSFNISDIETAPEQLVLRGRSLRPELIPDANIQFGGSGSNRTVTVTPALGPPGAAEIEILVEDEAGDVATRRFLVTAKEQHFRALPELFEGFRNAAAAWGDYDDDGDLDLIISGDAGRGLTQLYRNEGGGQFIESGIPFPALAGAQVAWGDHDNDGDLDLLLTASYEFDGLFLFSNEGGTNFVRAAVSARGYGWPCAAWGDPDNDGDLDFVVAGERYNNTTYVPVCHFYRNDGTNGFVRMNHLPQVDRIAGWADFDTDGWQDLVLNGRTPGDFGNYPLQILKGGLDGYQPVTLIERGFEALAVNIADLNGDTLPDLLLGTHMNNSTLLWRNLGGLEFDPWPDPLPPHGISAVADYDNDGWLDVLVSGYDHADGAFQYQTVLYRSALGESFPVADHQFPPFSSASAPTFADVDRDLDPDLLLGGQTDMPDYVTWLFRNDTLSRNTRPEPPGDLRAEAVDGLLRFSWTTARDANQTAALTYNVRVGTTPGAADVLGPMALPDGTRLLPAVGNAGGARHKLLSGLAPGRTYYWSVQSIDNAYIGSAFAAEAAFHLSHPPVIEPITDQVTTEDTPCPPIRLLISDLDDPAADIELSVRSSSDAIVPVTNATLTGEGSERELILVPAPDAHGFVTITVMARDPHDCATSASFALEVLPAADAPIAESFTVTTLEDTLVSFGLRAHDADGDPLTALLLRAPAHGVLVGWEEWNSSAANPRPPIFYQPFPDFFGEDTFSYAVTDGSARSGPAEVRLVVTPVPDIESVKVQLELSREHTLRLTLVGEPQQNYRLDVSEDLVTWQPVIVLQGTGSPINLVDYLAAGSGRRFYRFVPVP